MPKPNWYVLNYVILTTHSSHLYSMWDFTHTQQSPPHVWVFASLWPSRPLYVGHEQILLTPLCLIGFSLHQCIIHGSLVRHPWEPHVNPACTFMGTPHVHVHGNLAPHHYLAPLVIFFFPRFLCVIHLGFLYPCWVGTMNSSQPSRAHHHGLWYHLLK